MKRQVKREKGSILEPRFTNEDAAREWLENMRWPDGAVCPHCGLVGEAYRVTVKGNVEGKTEKEIQDMRKAKIRIRRPRKGVWACAGCRQQFSVTVKTIFEDSHIPLHKWLLAFHLINASKKGMSAHQLMRMLDIKQYKSAWFMAHRIRYAMTGELPEQMNGIIEADEAFIGGKAKNKSKSIRAQRSLALRPGTRQDVPSVVADKAAVFTVLQRGGRVHSRHIEKVTADNLKAVIGEVCAADAHLMTDTGVLAKALKNRKHSLVNHRADEYVRFDEGVCVTTNTVEGYFSLLKRGINGVYHHVGRKHLHRYLAEFDFRYNAREMTDGERGLEALKGVEGKRLMYRDS
ncbi:MAG TPA: IS1595 family transposase [Pyrinomonadaceae bacterium]|jgi:transposase-like protein|nr:IS1595 family transposase [Pyrinomonadaceae bacterium]